MRFQSALVLLIAILLGGVAAFFARNFLLSQTAAPVPEARTIVVAAQPLAFGAELTAENTRVISWPADAALKGTFQTKEQLFKDGRRLALSSITANEPILDTKVTGPGQRATLSTLIEHGMRAVAIRVDDVKGVAGFVLPNDRVDVVLTRGESRDEVADILLQNVKVLAVDQLASDQSDKPTVARAVTLELNAQDAQKVILAQGVGRLSLILNRAGGTAAAAPTTRVTVGDLAPAPAAAPSAPAATTVVPIVRDTSKVVNVVRDGNRREQYSVNSEAR
ncbi:Flp pilus assembly protein CpaB [Alsobacter sp. R-9]